MGGRMALSTGLCLVAGVVFAGCGYSLDLLEPIPREPVHAAEPLDLVAV